MNLPSMHLYLVGWMLIRFKRVTGTPFVILPGSSPNLFAKLIAVDKANSTGIDLTVRVEIVSVWW